MNDLKQILIELEIPINSFEKYDMDAIKKRYRYLIKKYHPDNCSDEERNYNTNKMASINKAMDSLKELIEKNIVIIKEKSEIKNDFSVIELMEKLNKLKLLIKNKQREISYLNIIKSIDKSLEYLEEINERINIYIGRGETYDYWDFINYIDLLYCYYKETINIDFEDKFEQNIKYKFNNNHLIEEKENISSLHRKLLYVKIKELISLFKKLKNNKVDYKKYIEKYNEIIDFMEEIDSKIHDIKWCIELGNINRNKLKERINKLGR